MTWGPAFLFYIYSSGFEINSTAVVYIYINAVIRVNIINLDGFFFFFKWQLNIKIRKKDQIFLSTHLFVVCWRFF